MKKFTVIILSFYFPIGIVCSQPWQQNDAIFNPGGVPSLPFSQPRFADLDGDGDQDMILGSTTDKPMFIENVGNSTSPAYLPGEDIFQNVSSLDAEMGVCVDIDGDSDPDLITGGFTGLHLYTNIGTATSPVFTETNDFFDGLNVGSNPVPDLADIDGDNDLDMVVGLSENGIFKIYENTGSVNNAIFSEDNVHLIGDVGLYAYPVFCDIDADDDQDILIGRDTYGFVFFENTGTPEVASWDINWVLFDGLGNETYWNSPDLADITGDGKFDLIFGNAAGPLIYYQNTGTVTSPVWQLNTMLFGGVLDTGGASNPYFFDFDGDGDYDLICGSQLGDIVYYQNTGNASGSAWQENSTYFNSIDHSIYSAIAMGDVNSDGLADAIVGDLSGHLYYHRNSGLGFVFEEEFLTNVALGGWSVPRLADPDGDDDLDIVAGNEAGKLFYFENQGSLTLPDWVEIPSYFGTIDVGTNCVPTVADLDDDGDLDVVTGNLWGDVQLFENQGGIWIENTEPLQGISGGQNTAPALIDLDNDGDLDLTLGNYSGTFNYFENRRLVADVEEANMEINLSYLKIAPNPFVNGTTIFFSITRPSEMTLSIYKMSGELVQEEQLYVSTGTNEFYWDASCSPPGIYLIHLSDGKTRHICKGFLVR